MYQLSLLISGLLANMFHTQRFIKVKEVEVQTKLDPRGLVATDIRFVRSKVRPVHWKDGMSIEQVAYAQGKEDMVKYIETHVIGRRTDGQPTTLRS